MLIRENLNALDIGPSTKGTLVPSFLTVSTDISDHVPTSCSFSVLCWAIALPGNNARPNAVIADSLRILRRSIVSSRLDDQRARQADTHMEAPVDRRTRCRTFESAMPADGAIAAA